MSVWKLVANFAIPPALVLTFLLILPLPTVLRRGLLGFTRNVLFFEVAGGFRLAHVMMLLTGAALAGTGFNTYKLSADVSDDRLTPNQRMGVLARKWREERNFWIATLAFVVWSLLQRAYTLMWDLVQTKERLQQVETQLLRVQRAAGMAPAPAAGVALSTAGAKAAIAPPLQQGMPPKQFQEPSAPPQPAPATSTGGKAGKKA